VSQNPEALAQTAEKQVSDRTSILIAANSFLFGAFATLLNSQLLSRWLYAIPMVFCALGIAINILLGYTNILQIEKITTFKKGLTAPAFYKTPSDIKPQPDYFKLFNQYGPIALIAAWSLCIVFFTLQITIGLPTLQ
jgi:hypothetical protein